MTVVFRTWGTFVTCLARWYVCNVPGTMESGTMESCPTYFCRSPAAKVPKPDGISNEKVNQSNS